MLKPSDLASAPGSTAEAVDTSKANLLRMYADHWQTLTGKRKIRNQRRNYEQILMAELPGAAEKTNLAMHAVLESELDDESDDEIALIRRASGQLKHETPLTVRNHALLHYFANLARSNNLDDKMDFAFVQSLVKNGASINTADKHGQTVFHEVARSWHTDVAKFLLNNGADLNKVDKYGRSPLHVASAVDYVDMVEFLLENGAHVCAKTYGECQTALHFAAKNDAVNAMKMLLAFKSDINCTDYKDRTPLQVAAELNRAKSATFLINAGASAAVCDSQGNSVISLLIERLPSVALKALDQFHLRDRINRKQFFYLNCLEPQQEADNLSRAKTPLEMAVLHNHPEILLHPVFQRLINVKWKKYGKIRAWGDLLMNVFYAIFWTILCVTQARHPRDHYHPLGERWWRIVIEIIVFLFTCYEARKQFSEIYGGRKEHQTYIAWKTNDLSRDKEYCHPRWPEEMRYLEQELKSLRGQRALLFKDAWNHFEWFTCTILFGTVFTYLVNYFYHSDAAYKVHMRVAVGLLIALWLRIMKYARPFRQTGPFVIILGHITADFLKWGVLFFIIYIPYAASFWMVFGGVNPTPVEGYGTVSELMFNVFRMTVVDQYNFHGLAKQDPTMAKLLCGTYIALSAVIVLNILIALLSHTFQRVYENAKSNAVMLRAKIILNLERSLSRKQEKKVHEYVINHCSPEVLPYEDECGDNETSLQATNKTICEEVEEMFQLVQSSLGKRCGRKAKSDFDTIVENVKAVKKTQEDLQEASLRIHVHLMKLENFLEMFDCPSGRSASPDSCKQSSFRSRREVASRSSGGNGRRTSKPKIRLEKHSSPVRRKCGVASLQHDPEMFTSFMKKQGSRQSINSHGMRGFAVSSDSNRPRSDVCDFTIHHPSGNSHSSNSGKNGRSLGGRRQLEEPETIATAGDAQPLSRPFESGQDTKDEKSSKSSSECSHSEAEYENFEEGFENLGLTLDEDSGDMQSTYKGKEKQL